MVLKSLYEELREQNPRKFKVDLDASLDFDIRKTVNACSDCIVRDCRSPEHCDPCPVNPDRKRLKRVGLL